MPYINPYEDTRTFYRADMTHPIFWRFVTETLSSTNLNGVTIGLLGISRVLNLQLNTVGKSDMDILDRPNTGILFVGDHQREIEMHILNMLCGQHERRDISYRNDVSDWWFEFGI